MYSPIMKKNLGGWCFRCAIGRLLDQQENAVETQRFFIYIHLRPWTS